MRVPLLSSGFRVFAGVERKGLPPTASGRDGEERSTNLVLFAVTLTAIAAVAYADSIVDTISLGYLYFLPLVLSAFVHRLRITIMLIPLCVILHDWLGPYEHAGWPLLVRNLLTLTGFSTVVWAVHRLVVHRQRLTEVVRLQRDELAEEIALAADVQQRLLPAQAATLQGFDLAGRMYPARVVGGDYYDYVELPQGNLGLVIADVSGKGVAAALLMASVEMGLRTDAPSLSRSDEIVSNLNRLLYEITDAPRYVTLFYGKLDVASRCLEYTNAGHLPPVLLRASAEEVVLLEKGGPVIGLFPGATFESDRIRLEPGDVLVLYTDGVVEAENSLAEQYSRERLVSLVRRHTDMSAQYLVERIYASVVEFTGTDVLRDDLTLSVLKVPGDGGRSIPQAECPPPRQP